MASQLSDSDSHISRVSVQEIFQLHNRDDCQERVLKDLLENDILLYPMDRQIDTTLIFLSNVADILENISANCVTNVFVDNYSGRTVKFIDFLKFCLKRNENRFVAYAAVKALVSLLSKCIVNECVSYIQETLCNEENYQSLYNHLAITKHLLSKTNQHCYCIFLKLKDSIFAAYTRCVTFDNNNEDCEQCMYILFCIFLKIAKLANIQTCDQNMHNCNGSKCWCDRSIYSGDEYLKYLKTFFIDFGQSLEAVLFNNYPHEFLQRKLLSFLCYLMKPVENRIKDEMGSLIYQTFSPIFEKLNKFKFSELLVANGNRGFIGKNILGNWSDSLDIVHLREWCYFCFCTMSMIVTEQGQIDTRAVLALCTLDTCVQELLSKYSSILFLWLPDIFGDQDDMWINILLLLMDISSVDRCSACDVVQSNISSHTYFVQFVSTIGFDHLVLIDLLTSPETNFLQYLLRYLKYMLKAWTEFKNIVAQFEYNGYINNNIRKQNSSTSCNLENASKHKRCLQDSRQSLSENGSILKPFLVETSSLAEDKIGGAINNLSTVSDSLSLIANMYSDNEVESDIVIAAESDNGSCYLINDAVYCDIYLDNTKGSGNNNEPDNDLVNFNVSHDDIVGSGIDIAGDPINYSNNANEIDHCFKNIVENSAVYDNVISDSFDDGGLVNDGDDVNDDGVDVSDDVNEDGVDVNDDDTDDDGDECVSILDKVMGMLIRVRLKIEKLWSSHLLQYNPSVLLKSLELVESTYET